MTSMRHWMSWAANIPRRRCAWCVSSSSPTMPTDPPAGLGNITPAAPLDIPAGRQSFSAHLWEFGRRGGWWARACGNVSSQPPWAWSVVQRDCQWMVAPETAARCNGGCSALRCPSKHAALPHAPLCMVPSKTIPPTSSSPPLWGGHAFAPLPPSDWVTSRSVLPLLFQKKA